VIIGYNFMGYEHGGSVWDTPICTDMLDELELNEGTYDEVYVNLDVTTPSNTAKPTIWTVTTIMDSKFTGDLDGGSIGAEGFKITSIQLYRSIYGTGKWDAVGQFKYDEEFNMYDYVDRYVQNGAVYQYAIVPVANEVQGDKLISDRVGASYEGIFITDKKENRRFDYDISLGEVVYNTTSALNQPLNSGFPIVTFGQSKYRSGNLSVLPLSDDTIALAGSGVDKLAEQINRQEWLDFINNGRAKVLRMDNGVLMLIVTQNATASHKEGMLKDLASLTFDYVEVGEINFGNMMKNDLIPSGYASKMTYDDNGGIISG
jgi:hypothetical protein